MANLLGTILTVCTPQPNNNIVNILRLAPSGPNVHMAANAAQLAQTFKNLAQAQNKKVDLQERIAEAVTGSVTDKLVLDYM